MPKTLHIRTTVQPGGKVEFASPELEAGQTVDVVVLHESSVNGRSIMEILNSGPERRLFQTAEEVRAYLAEEKTSWDRLTLPLAGLVYLDASGLIYSVERVEPYRTLLEPMWRNLRIGLGHRGRIQTNGAT